MYKMYCIIYNVKESKRIEKHYTRWFVSLEFTFYSYTVIALHDQIFLLMLRTILIYVQNKLFAVKL
jgi:hypothetical protein